MQETNPLWLRVTVPVASFAIPQAREFVESYPFPPPATVYGMLLSLIGETNRRKYLGVRLAIILRKLPQSSLILRKIRRVKDKDLNHPNNSKPDYQTVLTGLDFLIRVDDHDAEAGGAVRLTENVRQALLHPESLHRFGGLSCGESHHLVDQIQLLKEEQVYHYLSEGAWALLPSADGDWACPVWVDHVGSSGTVWEKASLVEVKDGFSWEQLTGFRIDCQ
ncbi:type I-MYXAN CRISPR-associated protein Cas5/Cmx5/DevS [Bacillaceae bacterium]